MHLNLQQTLKKKCTKSLYVYVCVLEDNSSTLELYLDKRKEKRMAEGWVIEEKTQLLKPCVQSADNQNRDENQSALREI